MFSIQLELYLRENIDAEVVIGSWNGEINIPLFLRNVYNFYEILILYTKCILLEVIGELPSIDEIIKHIRQVKSVTTFPVVIYYKEITRYRRKSLLENGVPFIVSEGQIYLPFLGLYLKPILSREAKKMYHFSTSTQLVYLSFLYNEDTVINATQLAQKMCFTVMTASRALMHLNNLGLLICRIGGKTRRTKEYRRIHSTEYFKKGYEYLVSPVKNILYVKNTPKCSLISGLSALAEQSMLNPTAQATRAIGKEELEKLNIEVIQNMDIVNDQTPVKLEVWRYNPKLFSKNKYVDPMSLLASLKEEKDERIQQALEQLLQGEKWYMD